MLDTLKFVKQLASEGYTHLCVVPCSFAKNFINAIINSEEIEYVPCASEAVACSVAAGLKTAKSQPIVVVQSSGLTNMGSCITSLLQPYGVEFPIITSWRTYKEGASEIQHKHLATELPNLVAAYGYEHIILDSDDIENALSQLKQCGVSNTICLLKKDSFTKVDLLDKYKISLESYTPRSLFLKALNKTFKHEDILFIGTTGNTSREMYTFMPDTNNFYMAGNMGGALSLGLGAAMAGEKVIVCGGDAEFAMHMGGLSTAGRYAKEIDLTYILFDNESNKSTGGQCTYQSHVDYIKTAEANDFNVREDVITEIDEFKKEIQGLQQNPGLQFMSVKCGYDSETPRPPIEIVKVSEFK